MGESLPEGVDQQLIRPTVLVVPPVDAGQRLDRWLAAQMGQFSRAHLQQAIRQGHVLLAGHAAAASARLEAGQRVQVQLPEPRPTNLAAEALALDVVYEDADLLVVDKPAGLVVHPAPGHHSGTLVNALLARWQTFKGLKGDLRPGIVHRLDKDTSGLIIVAKSDLAMLKLAEQIKRRDVQKHYLALVLGRLEPRQGRIEAPVGRHPTDRLRMAVVSGGRAATTHYTVERCLFHAPGGGEPPRAPGQPTAQFSLVRARPVTGRTHQIRVHLAFTGHPVAGDALYAQQPTPGLPRHFLHAAHLGFRQPTTGEWLELDSGLPPDLASFLDQLDEER